MEIAIEKEKIDLDSQQLKIYKEALELRIETREEGIDIDEALKELETLKIK